MATVSDLETEVLLSRLAAKAVKARNQVDRADPNGRVEFSENGFLCMGWWDGLVFRIELAKVKEGANAAEAVGD